MNDFNCTSTASQQQRLLMYLQINFRVTTTQAREELDIMHPAARVMELRQRDYNIVTHWETVSTGKAKHRVACYVLIHGRRRRLR